MLSSFFWASLISPDARSAQVGSLLPQSLLASTRALMAPGLFFAAV